MNRTSRAAFWIVAVIWTCAAVILLLVAAELWFKVSRAWTVAGLTAPEVDDPIARTLEDAYRPFAVQHLHPQYLFFFPLDPAERVAISNEVCSIDADGFRGEGPSHANGRRLAFIVG